MDRWKNWKRLNNLCLILALALVVCPATRAFANNGVISGNSDTTVDATYVPHSMVMISARNWYYTGSNPAGDFIVTTEFYIDIPYSETINPSVGNERPFYVEANRTIELYENSTWVLNLANNGWRIVGLEFELDNVNLRGYYNSDFEVVYNGSIVSSVNQQFGISSRAIYRAGWNYGGGTYNYRFRVRASFKANTTNVSSATIENLISTDVGITAKVHTVLNRWINVEDYEPYVKQNADNIQAISDALGSNNVAAGIVDQANQEFVQDAAQLESHQSVLENAADASVAAVDMNQVNLIDTYSQSVSFWGQLIGQLPTILGSLWYVFIFGLLIAFVLFVLRIRR